VRNGQPCEAVIGGHGTWAPIIVKFLDGLWGNHLGHECSQNPNKQQQLGWATRSALSGYVSFISYIFLTLN